ncbi:MAG: glycosyltransferase family 39 protein [Anaerolineae bacterium]|nr:glycosyltransferase family 39 protein [Anaerolineae bacterium]
MLSQNRVRLLALLILIILIALPILTYPLGRDQGEFATIGRGILNGHVPYKDLWNPKPPAVFYVYGLAMSIFGQTTAALRAIDLIMVPLISAALYAIARRIANPRVGLWATLIFPTFYFTETFWTLTQNDGIVLLPMTLAVVCALYSFPQASFQFPVSSFQSQTTKSQLLLAGLCGALCSYIVWFKYPFALFAAALVFAYLLIRYRNVSLSSQLSALRTSVAFLSGAAFVTIGGILYMMSIGAWDELLLSARVTAQYTGLTANLQDFGELLGIALGYRWAQWGLLAVLAACSFLLVRMGTKRGAGWVMVNLWLVAGLVIMLIQAKAYDYHWLPMLPPLALLAADSVDRILERLKRFIVLHRVMVIAVGGLFIGILAAGIWSNSWSYLTGQEDQMAYYKRFVAGEFVADESLEVANFLRGRVVPGDSLYIWGFRPEVYYMSGLNPATRFIFQFPLVADWYPPEWQEQNVDTLWAALPPYVLVLQVDYMPWVTGSQQDSNSLLQDYTELNNWLIFNYERETQIGNFFVWRRKSQ